jgi:hypothetical protein
MSQTLHEPAYQALQRPEAISPKIEDLMAEARRGRLRIPPFQRKFNWKREDARLLLDSIYRGYPIGTLLFWNTQAEAGDTQFGSVVIPGAARADAYWVVDGQQRVVSLVRTLLAEAPDADAFSLYFDLDEHNIVVPPKKSGQTSDWGRWLPMTELVDSERSLRWAFEYLKDQPKRREIAFDLGKRIREYPIPAYVVRADSDEPLRAIFDRVNSRGKPMKKHEVFDALNGARSGHRPSSIAQIAGDLGEMRFGLVDEKILYRLLRALQGADVVDRAHDGPDRLSDGDAATLYARTARAVRRAIEFLQTDAGMAHYALLPYKQPLVALGKFFDLHPLAGHRSRELLARWVWRGALAGTHSGDTVSTRRVLDAIDGDEHRSVQRLLQGTATRPARLPDATSQFNFRHAESKLELLALLALDPRDASSGRRLEPTDLLGAHAENVELRVPQIFPARAEKPNEPSLSVVNRVAHPYRPGIRKALADAGAEDALFNPPDVALLRSHGIDQAASDALLLGDAARFFSARRQFLQAHFESFFSRRAQWQDSDRPPISALVGADELA